MNCGGVYFIFCTNFFVAFLISAQLLFFSQFSFRREPPIPIAVQPASMKSFMESGRIPPTAMKSTSSMGPFSIFM